MNKTRYFFIISFIVFLNGIMISCNGFSLNQPPSFIETLPEEVKKKILWFCDYEDRSFVKWEDAGTDNYYSGGGIYVTDDANTDYGIEHRIVHSGKYSSYATIFNATTPGEKKAIRFMRWTDKAWNNNGDYFPDEAYYSVFMYFPEVYNPAKPPDEDPYGDGGWWNIFQFKSNNHAGSQPVVILDLYNENDAMYFGLIIKDYPDNNSNIYSQKYIVQTAARKLLPGVWHHVEVWYKKSKDYTGAVKVWLNGYEIFAKNNIRTVLPPGETAAWGIGNYTDYIAGGASPGKATIYFDDAIVSSIKISDYLE